MLKRVLRYLAYEHGSLRGWYVRYCRPSIGNIVVLADCALFGHDEPWSDVIRYRHGAFGVNAEQALIKQRVMHFYPNR